MTDPRLLLVLAAILAACAAWFACRDRCVPGTLPRHLDPAICHRADCPFPTGECVCDQ